MKTPMLESLFNEVFKSIFRYGEIFFANDSDVKGNAHKF